MKTLDRDGRLLCELQGKIFEASANMCETSSAVFIRRYMNSDYAARMDCDGFIDRPTDLREVFSSLDEEYGNSTYGSTIFSSDELFWIGYTYRCWSYVYGFSSRAVYRISNAKDMHLIYYAYHTLDPINAIERIMESKGIAKEEGAALQTAVSLLRKIRYK